MNLIIKNNKDKLKNNNIYVSFTKNQIGNIQKLNKNQIKYYLCYIKIYQYQRYHRN